MGRKAGRLGFIPQPTGFRASIEESMTMNTAFDSKSGSATSSQPSTIDQVENTECFSAQLAFRYGIIPALILSRVALFCRDLETHGRPCLRITQTNLAQSFPYLKKETVIKAIQKLTARKVLQHKPRKHGDLNRAAWSYCVELDVWEAARTNLIEFKIEHALRYGYRKAILLAEIQSRTAGQFNPATQTKKTNPTALAMRIPMGITTIRRKLRELVKAGVVIRCRGPDRGLYIVNRRHFEQFVQNVAFFYAL